MFSNVTTCYSALCNSSAIRPLAILTSALGKKKHLSMFNYVVSMDAALPLMLMCF